MFYCITRDYTYIKGVEMGAKSILLLGLIISTLFVYFCIDSKKDKLYAQLIQKKEPTTLVTAKKEALEPIIIKKEKKKLKEPSFAYIRDKKTKVAGIFSREDNRSEIITAIKKLCQDESCIQDIHFYDNISPYQFNKETLRLIQTAQREKIEDFALFINKKHLSIEGTLMTQEQHDLLEKELQHFLDANYTIENKTEIKKFTPAVEEKIDLTTSTIKQKPKIGIIKEEITHQPPRDIFVTPQHLSTEEASEQIDTTLMTNPITFDYRSSRISESSKKILDDIADILLGLDAIMIEVAGYTDAKGDAIYNKVLSQKRADSVRNYLINAGLRAKLITSKGYGEQNPIASPEDSINRRVEIHITEGK